MLRAALIGFPSSGKTTLFQLMTSIKDAPRGKGDVNIGISRVPDPRLDVLTGMYNPRKRVPATVEFTDLIAPARAGAQGLVDVAAYKTADALVHVVQQLDLVAERRAQVGEELREHADVRSRFPGGARVGGPDGLVAYRAEKNAVSIDGLPGL